MKKSTFFYWLSFSASVVMAQTGIGTIEPKGTLDIVGSPTDPAVLDGVIPPRLTGNQLFSKTYTTEQDGIIVYVTQPPWLIFRTGQVADMNEPGLYVFDATTSRWVQMPISNADPTYTRQSVHVSIPESTLNCLGYVTPCTRRPGPLLPGAGLIEIENTIRINIQQSFLEQYSPVIESIAEPFTNIFTIVYQGSSLSTRSYEFSTFGYLGFTTYVQPDKNNAVKWNGSETEALIANIVLPNGHWYEIEWFAYDAGTTKEVFMTAERKF